MVTYRGAHGRCAVQQLWQLLEPVHADVHFDPETYEEAGAPG
ncbi:hypothetical protein ACIQZO_03625 [Streptomyces sp. NPDC097617]